MIVHKNKFSFNFSNFFRIVDVIQKYIKNTQRWSKYKNITIDVISKIIPIKLTQKRTNHAEHYSYIHHVFYQFYFSFFFIAIEHNRFILILMTMNNKPKFLSLQISAVWWSCWCRIHHVLYAVAKQYGYVRRNDAVYSHTYTHTNGIESLCVRRLSAAIVVNNRHCGYKMTSNHTITEQNFSCSLKVTAWCTYIG